MTETWLQPNRRILALAMLPVGVLGAVGWLLLRSEVVPGATWIGGGCVATAGLLLAGLLRQFFQPRIAYRDGRVLFFLRAGGPISVPLPVVEAFFQGESLAHLPGESRHHAKSVNLIARLSQRATEWHQRDVKTALGCWEEGYVTVRGTWCEPITGEVIRRLNRRLGEVRRESPSEEALAES